MIESIPVISGVNLKADDKLSIINSEDVPSGTGRRAGQRGYIRSTGSLELGGSIYMSGNISIEAKDDLIVGKGVVIGNKDSKN